MNNAQLINQDSGNTEYYTPLEIIEAARDTMGGLIDFDPFSSREANKRVKATTAYTKGIDAFQTPWPRCGTVWMNHPFGRKMNKVCVDLLIHHYISGRIREACCITFAATSERWFAPLHEYPQCYLIPRTQYYLPDGTRKKGVTKGSVVTYLGSNPQRFIDNFRGMGAIKLPVSGGSS